MFCGKIAISPDCSVREDRAVLLLAYLYLYVCRRLDTFARCKKYSSKLDIFRSLIRIFAPL